MKKLIIGIIATALFTSCITFAFYLDKFGFGYFEKASDWGAVGDFFGGILNPAFTFLSIVLLAYTLHQNKKALKQSQEALDINNDELRISSKALTSSAESQHAQNIGNTFFNLLEQHNNIVNALKMEPFYIRSNLKLGIRNVKSTDFFTGRTVFSELLKLLHESSRKLDRDFKNADCINAYKLINGNFNHVTGHYFRNLFQIIVYIDTYCDDETKIKNITNEARARKKNFMRILRAQLSSDELILLLINCTKNVVDEGQFKQHLIKYELLKHIQFEPNIYIAPEDSEDKNTAYIKFKTKIRIPINDFLFFYNNDGNSAFGDNPQAAKIKAQIDEAQAKSKEA